MARKALVEILGDASGFVRSLSTSARATKGFERDLKSLSVNVKASAEAQVVSSVKKTARLREEAAAYRALAGSAARGSAEQVSAANLAARADRRLASSLGVTAHESARLRTHAGGLERDLGRATRGALAGSGVFRGLGRSIAFASGGFLAFASLGQFIRTSIDAAKEAQVTHKQLAAQFVASGLSLKPYEGAIDRVSNRLALLAGFENDEVKAGFVTIFRASGNVAKSLRDVALAADIARAKHFALSKASTLVAKVEAGNIGILRRQGVALAKNATVEQALTIARLKFLGQAKAGTTEQERFGAVLHNTEEIIGTGILPTLNKYLASGAIWLTQMNESGKLQKDVANVMGDVKTVLHDAGVVAKFVTDRFRDLNRISGSSEHTLLALAAAWGIFKARSSIKWALLRTGLLETGAEAAVATTRVTALSTALLRLGAIGIIPVGIAYFVKKYGAKNVLESFNPFGDQTLGPGPAAFPKGESGASNTPYSKTAERRWQREHPTMATTNRAAGFSGGDKAGGTGARALGLTGRFNLAELKLADAQRANNTKLQRSILASEEAIVLKLRDQAKTLKDRTKYAQQAASIQSSIEGIDQAAAEKAKAAAAKRKAAADKVAAGGVPLSLQLAQAKADAIAAGANAQDMTKGQIRVAKQIRSYEMKAIKSHRLSMQGLIDAWSQIGSINSQLAGAGKGMIGTYHHVSTAALTRGLNLSRDAAVTIRQRAAQRDAHRGYAPSGPAALGQPIHIGTVNVHGVRNVDQLYSELEKVGKRRGQRRGTR